jgi:PAS domain S-box-containing protein
VIRCEAGATEATHTRRLQHALGPVRARLRRAPAEVSEAPLALEGCDGRRADQHRKRIPPGPNDWGSPSTAHRLGNLYTPTSNTACGLFIFQADGVKQQASNLFGNEVNLCNVGRGVATPTPDSPARQRCTGRPAPAGVRPGRELNDDARASRISHTSVMATGLGVGGDVEQALHSVGVPSYVLDKTGIVRWINPAAERLVGDVRGRHFTSVVAPEDRPRARERFAQKMLGTSLASEATGHLVSTAGTRVPVEVSSVPLMSGERVVGVFGLLEGLPEDRLTAPPPHLTPRQVEVLRLLEQGRSTKQIAAELHLSTETVRNHIRGLFRALGVNSRLEAVAAARAASP